MSGFNADWKPGGNARTIATKYPWDQWMDGSVWKLTRGEDFDPKYTARRMGVSVAAFVRRKRLPGRVRWFDLDDDHLVIQFMRAEYQGRTE